MSLRTTQKGEIMDASGGFDSGDDRSDPAGCLSILSNPQMWAFCDDPSFERRAMLNTALGLALRIMESIPKDTRACENTEPGTRSKLHAEIAERDVNNRNL